MIAKLRVVVADDEPEMRDFFEKVLPRFGHHVVALAENGNRLVEHCRALKPDLVITDINMPDLDGIQASIEIYKERPVPIILISAYHAPSLIAPAHADYFQAYLVKPIGIADLKPAISMAVSRFFELQKPRTTADRVEPS